MSLATRLGVLALAGLLGGAPALRADTVEEADQAILELHQNNKLYAKDHYKVVRAAFARRFEAQFAEEIKTAYGDDATALQSWLDARPDLKQNFYTALDEQFDTIPAALALFRELWKKFPEQLDKFAELGIAVAVTWDTPKNVYDYAHHQKRTKSNLPSNLADGLANFQYFVENEKATEGRVRYLPWEFLVFVVDNRTPIAERKWAQTYYQANHNLKSMHQDVPYDHDLLKDELAKRTTIPKLMNQDYTLANIRKYGGVCAQQADFAARVQKSVALPAAYCRGASAFRGLHAWTLSAQTHKASAEKLDFALVSDGRFVGFERDAFYTGLVIDAQTGQEILDRDLERRLWLAGRDRQGKRHVGLLMQAYPRFVAAQNWTVNQNVAYLDKCLKIAPQSDAPWLELAKMVNANELKAEHKRIVRSHLSTVQTQFKDSPDFVNRLYADMLAVFEPAEQVKLYQTAVAGFEKAGRADLACDTRLRITDALADQKKYQTAFDGLQTTVLRFPTEGRFVPKLTEKMQDLSGQTKTGTEKLAKLYLDLLPKLAAYYQQDGASDAVNKLYDQAMKFYEKNSLPKYAAQLRALNIKR